ncbi:DUF202 domain-containing protein [Sediminibacillus massiliensis]|uniref:DUF202 domain-containing protein n=1 Tax=Sediminibacillus massiliensis TaxID=1926277 RepID=UPI00098887BF|nr:DUF202 domain-containing protein [Sediminibacillus massiliensis]
MSGNTNKEHTAAARDILAKERTRLANDRTLLAFIRTALTFFVGAAALIEFFGESRKLELTAYATVLIGFITLWIGVYRYYRSRKSIENAVK